MIAQQREARLAADISSKESLITSWTKWQGWGSLFSRWCFRCVSFCCSTFIIWQLINNTCASKVKCFQLPCICSIFLHAATNYTSCNIYSLQFVTHLAKLYTTCCTFLHWVPHVVHSATWLTSCCTFNYTLTAAGLWFTTFLIFRYIQM